MTALREAIQFQARLDLASLPYLADHRVQGKVVLPATAYLEMALAGAAEALGPGPHRLSEVAFQKMLFLPATGGRTIRFVLTPGEEGTASFQVLSLPGGAEPSDTEAPGTQWTRHVAGKVQTAPKGATADPDRFSPDEIRSRCPQEISPDDYYAGFRKSGLDYGPSFQGIKRLWRRDGEALAEVQLPPALHAEAEAYQVHPALLDAAIQVMAAALPADWAAGGGGTFVPSAVGNLRSQGRCGSSVWSHAVLRSPRDPGAGIVEGDVRLLDSAGQVLVEIEGLRAQRLGRSAPAASAEDSSNWLYELRWQAKPLPVAGRASRSGTWLVFTDQGEVGPALISMLEEGGDRCVRVAHGRGNAAGQSHYRIDPADLTEFQELFARSLGDVQRPWRGVIHLWSLDTAPSEEITPASLDEAVTLGCASAMTIVQELARITSAEPLSLWLITRGAQGIPGQTTPVAVGQSPLWGLGKVIALEHPRLRCVRVDLDPDPEADHAAALIRELDAQDGEDQVLFRQDLRHVPRLVPLKNAGSPGPRVATPGLA